MVSHCGLLYKLRSLGVGGQLLFIISEFVSDRRQRVSLDSKISASIDVILVVPQGSVLGSLLFITPLSTFTSLGTILWAIGCYYDLCYYS